eukprot:CAMPEP_0185495790 /NCGR_PEP_ID=MMETSP1366-20130426/17831_1 /TAXON_ID=38817 /ORGANISM="Gephyrocapsa oceanica, Strain RCC1303" /LENGTH=46 /DNA_ID= /DNA_START= /DNA_END= /DNA_ORIENTATION=
MARLARAARAAVRRAERQEEAGCARRARGRQRVARSNTAGLIEGAT